MEIGLIYAMISAAGFAGSQVSLRKGALRAGESFTAVIIATLIGTLLLSVLVLFTGDWNKLWSLSWQGFVVLGMAGIIHFILGRLFVTRSIRLIGANRASPIVRTYILYSVILGILWLGEPLTIFIILGVLFLAIGVTLVSLQKGDEGNKMHSGGILAGLGGALCWGTSGALIKLGVGEIGSPYAAAFISHIASFLVVAGLLFGKGRREQMMQLRRESLIPLVISGILNSIGQLLRYVALSYSPVSVIEPLIGTSGLFVFLLSFLINRNIEVFTWRVFVGIAATVAGTFLFFQ